MRKLCLALLATLVLTLTGCGGGGGGGDGRPPEAVTQIISNPNVDGDIAQPLVGPRTISQGLTGSLLAGIDPVTGTEYRAFIDFPLTGFGGVPGNAVIVQATLDIFIDTFILETGATQIPIRIDLVDTSQTLVGSDYDRVIRPPLGGASIGNIPIFTSDVQQHVAVDVTPLMEEAQRRGLLNFRVRILEDATVPEGLIEIDDTTGPDRARFAPLLEVVYF